MKKQAILLFALLTFVGVMALVDGEEPTFRFSPDPSGAGAGFWKGRASATASLERNSLPIQLPGPRDGWAGGEPKEIIIPLPSPRTTTLLIELLDSHESLPPLLDIRAGGDSVGRIAIKKGGGEGDHRWWRYGKRSSYSFTVNQTALGKDNTITLRSVKGSWIALYRLTLFQTSPPWKIWRGLGSAAIGITCVGVTGFTICMLLILTAGGRPRETFFALAAMIGGPLLFFVVIESTLALLNIADPGLAEDPYVGFQAYTPLFIADPKKPETLIFNQSRGMSDQRIPKIKGENVVRVAFFGGSNTYKFAPELHLFAERLGAALDKKVETLNFGLAGYGSHRVTPMLDEAIARGADILVIYSGHNEFLEKRFFDEHIDEAAWLTAVKLQLQKLRLYQLSRSLFRKTKGATIGFHAATDKQETETGRVLLDVTTVNVNWGKSSDPDEAALILRQYEANLRRMVSIASGAGVPLLLATLATNDSALPRSPCLNRKISPAENLALRESMKEVASLFSELLKDPTALFAGDRPQISAKTLARATRLIDDGAAVAPNDADVLYWQGIVSALKGDYSTAQKLLASAGRYDCAPYRATARSNDIVRAVASYTETPLIDIARLITEKSPNGITCLAPPVWGDDWTGEPPDHSLPLRPSFDPAKKRALFFDHCHLNYPGKIQTLFALADRVASILTTPTR